MHLPQFHEIPENNEWWGEGFTEWTNLNRENKWGGLEPLFGQYNLLDKSTMEMQYKLSSEYGVYGFCYYHYYFKGKKLLEKPVENLLKWKDIPQNFCFCWANHSWKKSWNGTQEILVKQEYGIQEDWEEHFEYLKSFFLDKRYIKVDNKPMFMIYAPFIEREEVVEFFNKKCIEIGFDGIYIITSYTFKKNQNKYPVVLREPIVCMATFIMRLKGKILRMLSQYIKPKSPKLYNGQKLMRRSIRVLKKYKGVHFPCAFSMWNNTYRHGARGYIITPPSKKTFVNYIRAIKNHCTQRNIEYCFFNAWNEWAEGMVLEPDTVNGYKFLEGVKEALK